MKLTEREKKLLRQQAEAYAFIKDLRDAAKIAGDALVIRRTKGIEDTIERRKKEYPEFQQYFDEAFQRGAKERLNYITAKQDGQQRIFIQRREEEPQAKTKKQPAKRKPQRRRRKQPASIRRKGPE